MGSKQASIPAQLRKLQERLERWRRTHVVGSRLPDELWAAAVEMAGVYGLNRTAKTLRLDYNSLRKRVGGQSHVAVHAADQSKSCVLKSGDLQKSGGVRFVELANSSGVGVSVGGCECSVEWEDAAGSKMRVHLKGTAMPDLAALSRSFWNPANKEAAS